MTKSVSVKRSIRIQKWIDQVRDYNQRPEGESMTAWCKRNGIPTSTFATRLHRVQDLYLDQLELPAVVPTGHTEAAVRSHASFVELPTINTCESISEITITCGNSKISVPETISETFLSKLIGALSNVK